MENNIKELNGLVKGTSFLENTQTIQTAYQSDLIHIMEAFDAEKQSAYQDEGFTVSDYRVEDFGEAIILLDTIAINTELIGTDDAI